MNKPHWEKYYKNKRVKGATSFAKYCNNIIPPHSNIIELGSGNGRDCYYFGKKGHQVAGVDYATRPVESQNVYFIKEDVEVFLQKQRFNCDVVYSRFFLHAIDKAEVEEIICLSSGFFMAEARSINDNSFEKTHKRNLIDGNELVTTLIKNNFQILYFKEGKNMAIYKNQNPVVVRVIARKKNELKKKA